MRSMIRGCVAVAVVALAGSWGARVAVAQAKGIELNGFAGLYYPTQTAALQGTKVAVRKGSPAFGGRLTYWTSKTLGVEFTGGYSTARVSVTSNAGRFPRSTRLAFGSAKLLFNLTPGSKLFGVAIGGGAAALHVGKTVADLAKSSTDLGGVGDLAVRIHLGENVALRGDAEAYLYNGNFGKGNKFTQDVVLSGGLSIKF